MNHVRLWPAFHSTASRLKVFVLILAGVSCVSFASYYWQVAAHNALIQNASLRPRLLVQAKVAPPLVSSNAAPVDDSNDREGEFLAFMGDEMFRRGDVEGAAQAFQKALEQCPSSEQLHLKLALCFTRLNRSGEAVAALDEAIHIAPDFAEAHHQMGIVLMQSAKFAPAAEHFRELTRLKPGQPSAYNGLGLALARQGKWAEAARHFSEAIRLNPRYPEARFNLGQVHAQMGATGEAAAELDRALQINPGFHAARAAREQLRHGTVALPAQKR